MLYKTCKYVIKETEIIYLCGNEVIAKSAISKVENGVKISSPRLETDHVGFQEMVMSLYNQAIKEIFSGYSKPKMEMSFHGKAVMEDGTEIDF